MNVTFLHGHLHGHLWFADGGRGPQRFVVYDENLDELRALWASVGCP